MTEGGRGVVEKWKERMVLLRGKAQHNIPLEIVAKLFQHLFKAGKIIYSGGPNKLLFGQYNPI